MSFLSIPLSLSFTLLDFLQKKKMPTSVASAIRITIDADVERATKVKCKQYLDINKKEEKRLSLNLQNKMK